MKLRAILFVVTSLVNRGAEGTARTVSEALLPVSLGSLCD
jgi:hypothetical protein